MDKPEGSSLCHPQVAGSAAGGLRPTPALPSPGNGPHHWSPLVATRTVDVAPLDRWGDDVVFLLDDCSTLARAARVIRGGVTPRGGPCSGGAMGRPQSRRGSPVSSPRPWRGRGVRVRTPERVLLLPPRWSMLPLPTCSAALHPRGRGSSGPTLILSVCPELSEPDPEHPDCSDFREAAWLTPSREPLSCWNVTVTGRAHPQPGCLPAPPSRLPGAGLRLRGFAWPVG